MQDDSCEEGAMVTPGRAAPSTPLAKVPWGASASEGTMEEREPAANGTGGKEESQKSSALSPSVLPPPEPAPDPSTTCGEFKSKSQARAWGREPILRRALRRTRGDGSARQRTECGGGACGCGSVRARPSHRGQEQHESAPLHRPNGSPALRVHPCPRTHPSCSPPSPPSSISGQRVEGRRASPSKSIFLHSRCGIYRPRPRSLMRRPLPAADMSDTTGPKERKSAGAPAPPRPRTAGTRPSASASLAGPKRRRRAGVLAEGGAHRPSLRRGRVPPPSPADACTSPCRAAGVHPPTCACVHRVPNRGCESHRPDAYTRTGSFTRAQQDHPRTCSTPLTGRCKSPTGGARGSWKRGTATGARGRRGAVEADVDTEICRWCARAGTRRMSVAPDARDHWRFRAQPEDTVKRWVSVPADCARPRLYEELRRNDDGPPSCSAPSKGRGESPAGGTRGSPKAGDVDRDAA
ncbi:hypothetical protein C8J57DRAFT_1233685 [Mycena rebaudengoi]|nr:hypothetical protein C8J57DRAFT_1233685 [Mycena rebaudengoi]